MDHNSESTRIPTKQDTMEMAAAPGLRRSEFPEHVSFTPLLICFDGTQRGGRFPIARGENTIGRSSTANIHIDDELASRIHAHLTWENGHAHDEAPLCTLKDMGSRNGTELNGSPITESKQLHERDRILIGSTLLGFFFRDEGELQLERSLFEQATRDVLTGLENRHQFEHFLSHYIRRARRTERPLSLLVVDADNFKAINDTYGHAAGDLVLMHLANVIKKCCRSSELCARWGGEEFVVLLPESDHVEALAVAERILRTVAAAPLSDHGLEVSVTVSIGGTELGKTDSADELFRRADKQLLKAKQGGKNRLVFKPMSAKSLTTAVRAL